MTVPLYWVIDEEQCPKEGGAVSEQKGDGMLDGQKQTLNGYLSQPERKERIYL